MAVIGLVPARGGSKGIKKKSIAMCAGQPLLAYTCAAALESRSLDRVILSTDDAEIATIGRACGLEVPFLRPAELADDATPMLDVMCHALEWAESGGTAVDALVLLQPTSPLRQPSHIDEAVRMLIDTGAATVVSIVEVPHQFNPYSVMRMVDGRLEPFLRGTPTVSRRQEKPRLFARNGPAVLVVRPSVLRNGTLYGDPTRGYEMLAEHSYDVDTAADLTMVDLLLRDRAHKHA